MCILLVSGHSPDRAVLNIVLKACIWTYCTNQGKFLSARVGRLRICRPGVIAGHLCHQKAELAREWNLNKWQQNQDIASDRSPMEWIEHLHLVVPEYDGLLFCGFFFKFLEVTTFFLPMLIWLIAYYFQQRIRHKFGSWRLICREW